jgi:prophage tail gpP-like protein
MTQPDIKLIVQGVQYTGWETVTVRRSMESLADAFTLTYVDRWLRQGQEQPIAEGQLCTITVDGQEILDGFVDEAGGKEDGDSDQLTAVGRSAAGDLIDCSAIHSGGQWANATIVQIASDLLSPFGLSVRVQSGLVLSTPLVGFSLEEGETVASALDRMARMQGVLVCSDPGGDIVITRAGATRATTVIRRGVNVLASRRQGSWRERYSQYIVKAQSAATGGVFGAQASQRKAVATDPTVSRYRPLVVVSEDASSLSVSTRANWQRNVRAGRSVRWHYTLSGWKDTASPWAPNVLVHVTDERWSIDADLLLVSATFTRTGDGEGTTTELELCDPLAFDVAQPPSKLPKKRRTKAVTKLGK